MLKVNLYRAQPKDVLEIRGSKDERFDGLIALFDRLARERVDGVALTGQPFLESPPNLVINLSSYVGGKSFLARLTQHMSVNRLQHPSVAAFSWAGSLDEWEDVAFLAHSLRDNGQEPGHHYLAQNAANDAQVVLSKGEYPMEDMKRGDMDMKRGRS
jgi:hypothetical protein